MHAETDPSFAAILGSLVLKFLKAEAHKSAFFVSVSGYKDVKWKTSPGESVLL